MELINESRPKANKEHTCMWCGGKINKGEIYDKSTIKNGNDIYEWKNHIKCSRLYSELDMYDYDLGEGVDSDGFLECVYGFINLKLSEEERVKFWGEKAVDKAIEILEREEQI